MKNLLTNWKTTLAAVFGVILFLLGIFDAKTFTPAICTSIITILAAFGFAVAKDGNVTGIGSTATTIETAALPLADALTANSNNVTIQDIHKVIDALKPSQAPVTVNVAAHATPPPPTA